MRFSRGLFQLPKRSQASVALQQLAGRMARSDVPLPDTLEQLCNDLSQTSAVDLASLLADTPRMPATVTNGQLSLEHNSRDDAAGDSVTDALTVAAHLLPAEAVLDVANHPELWTDFAVEIADVVRARDDLALTRTLRRLRATGWASTADAVRALADHTGPVESLLAGLDSTDAAVLRLILQTMGDAPH